MNNGADTNIKQSKLRIPTENKLKAFVKNKKIMIIIGIFLLTICGIVVYLNINTRITKVKDKTVGGRFYPLGKKSKDYDTIKKKQITPPTNNQMSISLFIKIDDWYENFNSWKHVLHKGSKIDQLKYTAWNKPHFQCPGIWLAPKINNLRFVLTIYQDLDFKYQYVDLNNIPIERYFHIVFTVNRNVISIYLDGSLVKHEIIKGVPVLTEGDVYVNHGVTYKGFIKNIQFFDISLNTKEIREIRSKHK